MSDTCNSELLVGQPIRDSFGITCCPAISQEDGKQYYIKTIRIPASAIQASGLLLSGAYENAAQIQEYYQSIADELCKEADVMKQLRGSGFLSCDSWELSAVENGIGYTLTLQSPRFETILDRKWTYLDAINLGLDLCNALSACRQKGYLYADLKPENIFLDEDDRFCIGDLGFLPLDSLQYTSLPEKYRSVYTAPEIDDVYASVSANLDVYALGLMLYQIMNENQLPQGEWIPPIHADYELWKIISTACHADPLLRYENPAQFAQALLSYLQSTGAENQPIGFVQSEEEAVQQDDTLFLSEAENEAMLADLLSRIPDEQPPADVMDEWFEETDSDILTEEMLAQADELICHQLPQPVVAPAVIDVQLPQIPEAQPVDPVPNDQMPEYIPQQEEPVTEHAEPDEEAQMDFPELVEPEVVTEEDTSDDTDDEEIWDAPKKTNVKKVAVILSSIVLVLALLIGAAVVYYNLVYTQSIDELSITVHSDGVTVQLQSDANEDLLTVVCSNSYGHTVKASVDGGNATISGLIPNTTYTLQVQISGFHRLIGDTSEIFTTPDTIRVSSFTAVTDVWQGSVMLSVVATGNDRWKVRYYADGEAEQVITFSGTGTSISGLTLGKEYTFILEAENGAPIIGTYTAKHTVH